VKTTLNLNDDLMRAVKARARSRGVTVTRVVEEALRQTLTELASTGFRLELPVTHGRRTPTLDVDSTAAIEEYLDRFERESGS
jgi:hypothetical protein